MRTFHFLVWFFLPVVRIFGQSVAPAAHVENTALTSMALTHATIHIDARNTVLDATLLIKEGVIIGLGKKVDVPKDAVTIDMQGRHLWPALVEVYSDFGMPVENEKDRVKELNGARHWNNALRSETRADELLGSNPEKAKELREQGFATVITHRMDGIARGTSTAVALDDGPLPKSVIEPTVTAHFSLNKGSSSDAYPSSQMGAIALVRQAFIDAFQYSGTKVHEQRDVVLEMLAPQLKGRMVFEANDRNELLRWSKLLTEFELPGIVKCAGDEYARLASIKATGLPLIIPVDLPVAIDVEDPYDAQEVTFSQLKHWELAPHNAALLDSAGITFAFTAHGRKDLKGLWKDLRKMVASGLDSSRAIELFTIVPAQLFGLDDRIGSLQVGKRADVLVTSQHLLDPRNIIHETWVGGKRNINSEFAPSELKGRYDLNLGDVIWTLDITEDNGKVEAKVRRAAEQDSSRVKASFQRDGALVSLSFAPKNDPKALYRLSGTIHRNGLWDGQGQRPGGQWFKWSAIRKADKSEKAKADSTKAEVPTLLSTIPHPLVGSGWTRAPTQSTIIFRHATVWTNGPEGILRNADVCIHEGKVKAVGVDLSTAVLFPGKHKPEILELDATGKHLTSGIVDEHSHIAISKGVNEGTQNNTAEVRIGDVVNPDDINIYRDLAGGVTTVQLLHGSANPIGGQSALIKLRWGHDADSLLISDAPKHIKFALGENVKQSNWSRGASRFPQTRMGVEQVFYDAFHRARRYDAEWRIWQNTRAKDRGPQPRRDLELEAIAEILRGERNITCHSYVQGEIDMLMHVADSMGFKVNTFTHILEGYKMADKLRAHGVNASTFSDWWAYKFEVYDAIPYNAALLYAAGVNTGINSDDAEMSRRLNQEAAKTMKYGGVPEEAAWKMVTLNPARMLKLDHRIGSVEAGKDADIVLWNENPLSIRAKAEKTFVDGVCYFDRTRDVEQRSWISTERDRIVREMIAAKKNGEPTKKADREKQHLWHCDDLGDGVELEHLAP